MRSPHVYERSAPRAGRSDIAPPEAHRVEVAHGISRALPDMIDDARSAGMVRLAEALEVARAEAEIAMGKPVAVAEG